jgi:hypothetical protein
MAAGPTSPSAIHAASGSKRRRSPRRPRDCGHRSGYVRTAKAPPEQHAVCGEPDIPLVDLTAGEPHDAGNTLCPLRKQTLLELILLRDAVNAHDAGHADISNRRSLSAFVRTDSADSTTVWIEGQGRRRQEVCADGAIRGTTGAIGGVPLCRYLPRVCPTSETLRWKSACFSGAF